MAKNGDSQVAIDMARLLNRGSTLIQEHLDLIAEFYHNSEDIKEYLQLKGVSF